MGFFHVCKKVSQIKITIEPLEFPLCVKEKFIKIPKISKLHIEFVNGKNIEIHQRNLKIVEEKNNDLSNRTKAIKEILENLKGKGFVKSELVMNVIDRDNVITFVHLVDRAIAEYKSIQELTTTLKEVETELLNNRSKLKLLKENNE